MKTLHNIAGANPSHVPGTSTPDVVSDSNRTQVAYEVVIEGASWPDDDERGFNIAEEMTSRGGSTTVDGYLFPTDWDARNGADVLRRLGIGVVTIRAVNAATWEPLPA